MKKQRALKCVDQVAHSWRSRCLFWCIQPMLPVDLFFTKLCLTHCNQHGTLRMTQKLSPQQKLFARFFCCCLIYFVFHLSPPIFFLLYVSFAKSHSPAQYTMSAHLRHWNWDRCRTKPSQFLWFLFLLLLLHLTPFNCYVMAYSFILAASIEALLTVITFFTWKLKRLCVSEDFVSISTDTTYNQHIT